MTEGSNAMKMLGYPACWPGIARLLQTVPLAASLRHLAQSVRPLTGRELASLCTALVTRTATNAVRLQRICTFVHSSQAAVVLAVRRRGPGPSDDHDAAPVLCYCVIVTPRGPRPRLGARYACSRG